MYCWLLLKCLEFKSAVKTNRKMYFFKDVTFQFPEKLPDDWLPYDTLLRSAKIQPWDASVSQECAEFLHKELKKLH